MSSSVAVFLAYMISGLPEPLPAEEQEVPATLPVEPTTTAQEAAAPQASQPSPDPFQQLVAEVEKFYSDKQDFSAVFEQTMIRSHLPDRPLQKRGKLYFKKPGMMRWDYLEPEKIYYVSDGKVLWNYVPESKLAYKMKVEDSELSYALKFLWGEVRLSEEFIVSDGAKEGEARVIVVKPRTSEQEFKELRLLVAVDQPVITGTIIIDPAGNESRVRFVKSSFQELPVEGFSFKPPADAQIEDLSNQQGN
jgi:outer membrane lipoprotein carrier protein